MSRDLAANAVRLTVAILTFALAPALPAPGAEADPAEEYLEHCSLCHGVDGQGTSWAPANADVGAAGAFFWMATGRMPLDRPDQPVTRSEPKLSPEQIAAIAEYVGSLGEGPEVPEVEPASGDIAEGARIYLLQCAACHGATGIGGAMVDARNAPNIIGMEPVVVAAAIRSGPAAMPVFDADTLTPEELNSVVAYVGSLSDPATPGGWGLGGWGAVAEGAVAWILGIALSVGAAIWIKAGTAQAGHEDGDGKGGQE